MNQDQEQLAQLIDACRRLDDLQLPELQPLAAALTNPEVDQRLQRSQRIDAVIGRAIHDVPVPEGLEARLLAALGAQQEQDAGESAVPIAVPPDVVSLASRPQTHSWRVWLAMLSSVAAILLIAVLAMNFNSAPSFDSEDAVAQQAEQWLGNLNQTQWPRDPLPQGFPLPSRPVLSDPYGWQWVPNTHRSLKVACYNIPKLSARTYLFVCHGAKSPQLPAKPANRPIGIPSGWQIGSWQEKEVVYVLAVFGKQSQYESVISRNQRVASGSVSPRRGPRRKVGVSQLPGLASRRDSATG